MKTTKKHLTVFSIFFFFHFSSIAQMLWIENEGLQGNLKDRISTETIETKGSPQLINFHSCASFGLGERVQIEISKLNQCQIFTVFKPNPDSNESLIWKFENASDDQLLFTDQRMYDFTKSKFMNFVNQRPNQTKVYSYQHYRTGFEVDKLLIGGLPKNDKIPVQAFDGNFAELIIFDRVLAPTTRKAFEAYLALKYSLPLEIGEDYVMMDGRKIWDFEGNKEYPHRLAGLARNDDFNLFQKQSKSQLEGGFLILALNELYDLNEDNPSSINNHEFLLWSDDGNTLDFEMSNELPSLLKRNWRLNAKQFSSQHLYVGLDHQGIMSELENNQKLWLILSKDQLFPIDETNLYPLNEKNGKLETKDVAIRPELYHFSFIKAPKLWLMLEVEEFSCEDDHTGSLKIRPVGGKAPYSFKMTAPEKNDIEIVITEGEIAELSQLENAMYRIELKDARGETYVRTININSIDIDEDEISLSTKVSADEIKKYFQQYDQAPDLQYTWILPSGERISKLAIEFEETGEYILEMLKNGCKSWKTFEVQATENNILNMFINPNPSSSGYFNLTAKLKMTAEYSIDIITMEGKRIFAKSFPQEKYINYHGQLSNPGIYNIRLSSNGSQLSKKLIIVK